MDNNGDFNNQTNQSNPNGNYNPQYYQNNGYNQNGYDPNGYNQNGYNLNGYNQNRYNQNGYNQNGYNQNGYNQNGYYQNGYYQNADSRQQAGGLAYAIGDVVSMSFMFMFVALLITGITSLYVAKTGLFYRIFSNPIALIAIIVAEFAIVIGANVATRHNNAVMSGILFFAYSIVNGLMLSVIFLAYSLSSITSVFFLTAGIFGIMAIYGALTKKDLTSWGSILFMGLLGIILAGIVNIFLHSSGLDFLINIIGVIIFVGLTAYDTQKIKKLAASNLGFSVVTIGMWGALELYLDFINLFLKLLSLLGRNRN